MVESGLSRSVVNQRIGRIKRIFKWAVSEQLIPASVLVGLQSVTGLQAGRTDAREAEPVKPVQPDRVEAVLPFLRPQVVAMVKLQRLTGMRPGEVCRMRSRGHRHERAGLGLPPVSSQDAITWKGSRHLFGAASPGRVEAVPSSCQARRRRYGRDRRAALCRARSTSLPLLAERRETPTECRASIKTENQALAIARSASEGEAKTQPQAEPADAYTPMTCSRAIARACDAAFALPEALPSMTTKPMRSGWPG